MIFLSNFLGYEANPTQNLPQAYPYHAVVSQRAFWIAVGLVPTFLYHTVSATCEWCA